MSQLYYTTCNPIVVGCQLFLDAGTTLTVPAGFYSNGNNCYTCDSSGFVISISTCLCSNCDQLYIWSAYNESCCYRVEITGATAPTNPIALFGKTAIEYSDFGTQFFDFGFNTNGTGTVIDTSTTQPIWRRTQPSGYDGPLNRCALWTSGNEPYYTWLGFSVCLSGLTTDKTYYVGIAADNNFRLVLDGTQILNTIGGPLDNNQNAFKYWHVYPVMIGAGNHVLELFGENNGSIAGFGCEIYDNTLQDLTGFTSYNQLNVIFTSSGQTQATIVQDLSGTYSSSGFTCPSGFTYSECDGNCIKYEFCCPSGTPTPTVTTTLTPTPTPTPTQTSGLNSFIAYHGSSFTNACENLEGSVTLYTYGLTEFVNGETYYQSDGITPYNGLSYSYWADGLSCTYGTLDSGGLFTLMGSCPICA